MKKYAVVIERGENNLSAYVPDLPGCITTGHTVEEIEHNMREAIELHLEGMIEDGETIPEPTTAVSSSSFRSRSPRPHADPLIGRATQVEQHRPETSPASDGGVGCPKMDLFAPLVRLVTPPLLAGLVLERNHAVVSYKDGSAISGIRQLDI